MSDLARDIRAYLAKEVFFDVDESTLSFEARLLEQGILDSVAIQSLILFLEEQFGVVIRREDLVPENFETINSIASLVQARQET